MNRRELVERDEDEEWCIAGTDVPVVWALEYTSYREFMAKHPTHLSRAEFGVLLSFPDPTRSWEVGGGEFEVQSDGTLYVSGVWATDELPALIAALTEAQAHLEQWERDVEAWLEGGDAA